jgi:hypothetical protein
MEGNTLFHASYLNFRRLYEFDMSYFLKTFLWLSGLQFFMTFVNSVTRCKMFGFLANLIVLKWVKFCFGSYGDSSTLSLSSSLSLTHSLSLCTRSRIQTPHLRVMGWVLCHCVTTICQPLKISLLTHNGPIKYFWVLAWQGQ